ncbi:hypothetical protein U5922_011900 [Aquicoccus sp. G2-2]|uniref:hypothetical protein n=1 Tax=Aquicoccus sp. G2-2 TaxID=3092120 RepID=UPI00366D6A74
MDQKTNLDAEQAKPAFEPADKALSDEALSAVRQMMEAEERHTEADEKYAPENPAAANAERASAEAPETVTNAPAPRRKTSRLRRAVGADALPPLDSPAPEPRRNARARVKALFRARLADMDFKTMLRNIRARHVAIAMLVVVMFWKPWLIPGVIFTLFWVGLIAWLTMGPDRASEMVAQLWERFSRRFPARAATWLTRIQSVADKIDGWLARLPERWTDGIYLPDLGRSEAAAEGEALPERPDPFERLAAERQIGSAG